MYKKKLHKQNLELLGNFSIHQNLQHSTKSCQQKLQPDIYFLAQATARKIDRKVLDGRLFDQLGGEVL